MNSSVPYVESTQEKRLIYNFVCVYIVCGGRKNSHSTGPHSVLAPGRRPSFNTNATLFQQRRCWPF